MRRVLFAALAGGLLAALGAVCFHSVAEEAPMSAAETQLSTDADALARLITLPLSPQAVRYDLTGTGDQVLCALIEAAPEAVTAALGAAPVTHPDGGLLNVTAPGWMIAALGGLITVQPGGLQEVAAPLRDPQPFTRAPFLNGWVFAAGPGRIALCLFSM
jgi:hypothetical protein